MAAGVRIVFMAPTGRDYYASISRWSLNEGEGFTYQWNNTTNAWGVSGAVGVNDMKIPMSELSVQDYYVQTDNLDDYTGWICVRVHNDDNAGDPVEYIDNRYIVNGAEVAMPELYNVSSVLVSPARTWTLPIEGGDAPNIIQVEVGSTVTLAMDFSNVVNEGTTIASVSSVSVSDGVSLTTANNVVDQSKLAVHFDATCSSVGARLMAVTVVTTDGQTIVGEGNLEVT